MKKKQKTKKQNKQHQLEKTHLCNPKKIVLQEVANASVVCAHLPLCIQNLHMKAESSVKKQTKTY